MWIGVGIAITLAIGQDGLLINNARDGTSALLDFWSPRWELWSLAPSFIGQHWTIAWLHVTWWLAIAAGGRGAAVEVRAPRARACRRSPRSLTFSAALMLVAMTVPWLPGGRTDAAERIDLGARSRLVALDGFDARARPASMIYDPLHKGAAADALPQLVARREAAAAHRIRSRCA